MLARCRARATSARARAASARAASEFLFSVESGDAVLPAAKRDSAVHVDFFEVLVGVDVPDALGLCDDLKTLLRVLVVVFDVFVGVPVDSRAGDDDLRLP